MKKLLLLAIFANFFVFSLGQNNNCSANVDCPDALNRFTESVLVAAPRLILGFINSTTCATVALSPIGILFNIIALAYFAEGATKNETYSLLNITKEEMICVSNIVNSEVSNLCLPDCIEFRGATDYYGNNQYPFTSKFKTFMKDVIIGGAINMDLSNRIKSTNAVNSKVASQTSNRIKNIIADSSIFNPSAELISITATFLTGKWQIGMQSTTEVTEFRLSPTKSEKQTFLYADAEYLYGHSDILEAQVFQINFCCEAFYMWEILPDCPFTEETLIRKMTLNTDWYYEMVNKMKLTPLKIFVPLYNQSTTVDAMNLNKNANGLETIYDDKTIDLKGVIEGDCPAAVTAGVQKVYLVTGFEGETVAKESQTEKPKKTVKIDSPHVWIIFRNSRIHFIGVTRSQVS